MFHCQPFVERAPGTSTIVRTRSRNKYGTLYWYPVFGGSCLGTWYTVQVERRERSISFRCYTWRLAHGHMHITPKHTRPEITHIVSHSEPTHDILHTLLLSLTEAANSRVATFVRIGFGITSSILLPPHARTTVHTARCSPQIRPLGVQRNLKPAGAQCINRYLCRRMECRGGSTKP